MRDFTAKRVFYQRQPQGLGKKMQNKQVEITAWNVEEYVHKKHSSVSLSNETLLRNQ